MIWINSSGQKFDLERETKTLLCKGVSAGDYYNGKNHDLFTFQDENKIFYHWQKQSNSDSPFDELNYITKPTYVKISGYFVPSGSIVVGYESYEIARPRLIEICD